MNRIQKRTQQNNYTFCCVRGDLIARRRPGGEDRASAGRTRGQERLKIKAEARKWSFRARFLYSGIKYAQTAIFGPSRAQKKEPTRITANRLQPPTDKESDERSRDRPVTK